VTSKIVSKSEGRIVAADDREDAITAETVRVVASRPTPNGGTTRIVQQHQGEHSARFGLVRHQGIEHAGQPDRFHRQPRAAGVRVSLVEQQVEHMEDGGKPVRQQVRRWHPKRDSRVRDLLLGPENPLPHGLFGHQERSRDLGGTQPGQAAKS
jgi:hypothetical protein